MKAATAAFEAEAGLPGAAQVSLKFVPRSQSVVPGAGPVRGWGHTSFPRGMPGLGKAPRGHNVDVDSPHCPDLRLQWGQERAPCSKGPRREWARRCRVGGTAGRGAWAMGTGDLWEAPPSRPSQAPRGQGWAGPWGVQTRQGSSWDAAPEGWPRGRGGCRRSPVVHLLRTEPNPAFILVGEPHHLLGPRAQPSPWGFQSCCLLREEAGSRCAGVGSRAMGWGAALWVQEQSPRLPRPHFWS